MSEEPIEFENIEAGEPTEQKRKSRFTRPGWKILGALFLATLLWFSPSLVRAGLSKLAFFRLRKVEVQGVKYLQPADVVARIRVDTMRSIWDEKHDIIARLKGHPQITTVEVDRKMPSTLVIRIKENLPVALIPGPAGLEPYDSVGRELPIDPSKADIDVPVVATRDPELLRFLGTVRNTEPTFYGRISEVMRTGKSDFALRLDSSLLVRLPLGLGAGGIPTTRVADIFPVERDLAKRHFATSGAGVAGVVGTPGVGVVVELDLRYRDQVIARLK